ncbi:MAG: L,D-transpeptidase [Tatlockia sp.]|nr:L,D-transpeptidase [Tatlockia sp.]
MDALKIYKSGALSLFALVFAGNSAFAYNNDYDEYEDEEDSPKEYTSKSQRGYSSKSFTFNPRTLTWKAMANGKVIRSGKAVGGGKYCKDVGRSCKTPSGTFRVISKGGADCKSSRYPVGKGGAKMPYCMFFAKNYAVHGSYEMPNYNASHGCIRVQPEAARWLNHNFMSIGTPVIIKSY